jgi:hypothetical protein
MEPQTTILVILALCITLLVLIFAVGYSTGIAHAQKMGARPKGPAKIGPGAAASDKKKGVGRQVPVVFYPGPAFEGPGARPAGLT